MPLAPASNAECYFATLFDQKMYINLPSFTHDGGGDGGGGGFITVALHPDMSWVHARWRFLWYLPPALRFTPHCWLCADNLAWSSTSSKESARSGGIEKHCWGEARVKDLSLHFDIFWCMLAFLGKYETWEDLSTSQGFAWFENRQLALVAKLTSLPAHTLLSFSSKVCT